MRPTLSRYRDKVGHRLSPTALVVVGMVCALSAPAASAQSGTYKAERFDVTVTPTAGDLDVRETIRFQFQSGTFRRVWREIPSARTDGIEIVDARMDGSAWPRGVGDGHLSVEGRGRVRVQWNFAAVGPSAHSFELHYLARGAIYREGGSDVLRWRALPTEHRYTIDESRILFAGVRGEALPLETHRTGRSALTIEPAGVAVNAANIAANGWVVAELRYPAGTMIASLPKWQGRSAHATAMGPRWLGAGAAVLVLGLLILMVIRQGYTAPVVRPADTAASSPPEPLPAALAAALAANGRASAQHAFATLVDLASRGVLTVRELPRRFGVRAYELSQVPGAHDLADHEAAALDIAFGGRPDDVTLLGARRRLVRGRGSFINAVIADLDERGLIDPSRKAARDRVAVVSIAIVLVLVLASIGCAALVERYDGWPFFIPAGLAVAALAGALMAATMSPLSDAGALEAARWRAFKRYLKTLSNGTPTGESARLDPRWIVYGIALGLAAQWSRYLKSHPDDAPPWFVAASREDAGAFAAFVGSQSAAAGGHAGAGTGGGAAGGGGSGAA